MPGRKWYVVAGLVFVVGTCAFAATLFFGIRGLGKDFARFTAPGAIEFQVSEPGRHTIYRETGSLGGVYYETTDVAGLEVTVRAPDGSRVALSAPAMDQTYTVPGRRGYSIFQFDAGVTGRYRIDARYPAGGGSETILAVGRGFTADIVLLVSASVGMALVTVVSSLGIAAVTFVQRYRAARRRAVPPAPPGSPAPPVVP